jgi:hypothetical protein
MQLEAGVPEHFSGRGPVGGLWDTIHRRFPLLDQVKGIFGAPEAERVPGFIYLLLSICSAPDHRSCCIILPETNGIAALSAALLSLTRFHNDYSEMLKNLAESGLTVGQKVRVLPSGYVYRYLGIFPNHPNFYRLGALDSKGGSRSFPIADIVRLEPTQRTLPVGKLNSVLGEFETSLIDSLIGTHAGGNTAVIKNRTLHLGTKAEFARALQRTTLLPANVSAFENLATYFPWGDVDSNGVTSVVNPMASPGEPLVAVSTDADAIARASQSAEPYSKVVFADGPSRLLNNLQVYDRISERQKLVIISSRADRERVRDLERRGCITWEFDPSEVLLRTADPVLADRRSIVGQVIRGARVTRDLSITVTSCEDPKLDRAAEILEQLSRGGDKTENTETLDRLLSPVFDLLNVAATWSQNPVPQAKAVHLDAIAKIRRDLVQQIWILPEQASLLDEALRCLSQATEESSANSKGEALFEVLLSLGADSVGQSIAVASRSPEAAGLVGTWLKDLGISAPSYAITAITRDREFDAVVVTSWPGHFRFRRLVNANIAPTIRLIGYGFERRWLQQSSRRTEIEAANCKPLSSVRAALTNVELDAVIETDNRLTPVQMPPPPPAETQSPIYEFEERVSRARPVEATRRAEGEESRDARLIRFFDSAWTYLTEWHSIPRVTSLIEDVGRGTIERVTVSDVRPGDYLLFREGGDKEIIRLVAENEIGEEAYSNLRDIARTWRPSLVRMGSTPYAIREKLLGSAIQPSEQTIRNWLWNTGLIGPGHAKDLHAIAIASRDRALITREREIWQAIQKLRQLHIKSGHLLTRLLLEQMTEHVLQIGGKETNLDLAFGSVWVCQVAYVSGEIETVPAAIVNRLMWSEGHPAVEAA